LSRCRGFFLFQTPTYQRQTLEIDGEGESGHPENELRILAPYGRNIASPHCRLSSHVRPFPKAGHESEPSNFQQKLPHEVLASTV
jgi:hypothetical protein